MIQITKLHSSRFITFIAIACCTIGCTTGNKSPQPRNWQNMQPSFVAPSPKLSQQAKEGWLKSSISNIAKTLGKEKTPEKKDATHVDVMPLGGVDANVYTFAGEISISKEQWADAKKHFKKALSIDKENVRALAGMGSVLIEEQQYTEAIEYLRKGITLAEEGQALDLASEVSYCYMSMEQHEKAISILQALVNKAPKVEMYRQQLAYALTKNGQTNSALEHLNVVMDPAEALRHLAGIQNELGMVGEANLSLERAETLATSEAKELISQGKQQIASRLDQVGKVVAQNQQIESVVRESVDSARQVGERVTDEVNRQANFVSADLQPIAVSKFDAAEKKAAEARIQEKIALIEARIKSEKEKPLAKFLRFKEKEKPVARFSTTSDEKPDTNNQRISSTIESLLR